jgi:hypothetical protein
MLNWSKNNKLKLNKSKTNCIQFSSVYNKFVHPPPVLKMDDCTLALPIFNVFLGLRVNKHLDWSDHIDFICKKMRSGIYALGRLREEVSLSVLKMVYYAHVYSHIKNNVIFWGHCSDAARIFILQKRSIRVICKVPPTNSCVNLFKDLGILTMHGIYVMDCIMFVKKNLNLFARNSDTHSFNTRHCNDLSVFQHSKAMFEKSPQYRMVHIYNKLPLKIRDIANIVKFKKTVFKYLLNLNLYSLREYFDVT